MNLMRNELPIAVSLYGWGQVFRLYHDYLYVNGKYYALTNLTGISPTYRCFMGIPSARLELEFGKQKLLLRGFPDVEDVRKVVEYLASWCMYFDAWDVPDYSQADLTSSKTGIQDDEQEQRHDIVTEPLETPHLGYALQGAGTRKQYGEADVARQQLKEDGLPVVPVMVGLQVGEQAYYSTPATLCGECVGSSLRYTYPALDQGMLILTDKRILYIGRTSQVVLDYDHLLHVSRLRNALAFQADHLQKRVIFEMPKPSECSMSLEAILYRFQQAEISAVEVEKD